MILSNCHAIFNPTAWPIVVTVDVGLQTDASSSITDLTKIAAALGPSGIRPILYVGSAEQNSPSPMTTSSDEHQSKI